MKKFLKSSILELVKRRSSLSSRRVNRWLMGGLRIGFDPPQVEKIYPGGARSACAISIDFDHLTKSKRSDQNRWYPEPREDLLTKNAKGTRDMLAVSEKYSIPMTWAICGQTAEADRESYKRIVAARQPQEIGIHTYSHIDVSSCSEVELTEEVAKCVEVLKLGVKPRTFIFPWNRQGNFEVLKKLGFETYRDPLRSIRSPFENHGLVDLHPTYYVDQKSFGASRLMKKYLELCIVWNSVFHLWLHPWSVVLDGDDSGTFVSQTIDPLFAFMKKRREEGILSICTMGELAAFHAQQQR